MDDLPMNQAPDRHSEATRAYYDELADAEEDRLLKDVSGRVSFAIHCRFLHRFLQPANRVLEIGAGTGRFTRVLADAGAAVVVTDLSPVQLELNQKHLAGTPAEEMVERRELVDVRDTSSFGDNEFDVVLAFGGPLSYVFEDEQAAVEGLLRVTKPGGFVVASVMSLLGTWRHHLAGVVGVAEKVGEDANDQVLATGDMRHLGEAVAHQCRMFRSEEIRQLVDTAGGHLVGICASNWASLGPVETLGGLEADRDRWSRFLDHEVRACSAPGAVDGGTHILFAIAKPNRQ